MDVSPVTASSYAARIAVDGGNFYRSAINAGTSATSTAATADTVSISAAAWAAFGASSGNAASSANSAVDARLAEIKSKGAVNRSSEDTEYLLTHDKKLAEIVAQGKSSDQLTSSELDYMQKAGGFVNTMAYFNPAEKALYDKAVANGNTQAASGLALIALTRTGGHMAGGANGATYDPINTPITAANVEKYFRHSIVDPTGDAAAKFQALIQFLRDNPTTV